MRCYSAQRKDPMTIREVMMVRQPKERRLMWGGTVHIMYKRMSMWMTRCLAHTRYPRDFPKGYTGKQPVNCIECIAASTESDE